MPPVYVPHTAMSTVRKLVEMIYEETVEGTSTVCVWTGTEYRNVVEISKMGDEAGDEPVLVLMLQPKQE